MGYSDTTIVTDLILERCKDFRPCPGEPVRPGDAYVVYTPILEPEEEYEEWLEKFDIDPARCLADLSEYQWKETWRGVAWEVRTGKLSDLSTDNRAVFAHMLRELGLSTLDFNYAIDVGAEYESVLDHFGGALARLKYGGKLSSWHYDWGEEGAPRKLVVLKEVAI